MYLHFFVTQYPLHVSSVSAQLDVGCQDQLLLLLNISSQTLVRAQVSMSTKNILQDNDKDKSD